MLQMSLGQLFCALAILSSASAIKLLLIGDFSSAFVKEWCDVQGVSNARYIDTKTPDSKHSIASWGRDISAVDSTNASFCETKDHHVAQLTTYGSSDSGPYYRLPTRAISKMAPHLVKTVERVEKALGEYVGQFKEYPDRLIYSGVLADYFYAVEKTLFNKIFDSSQPQWGDVLERLRGDFKASFKEGHSKWNDVIAAFEKNYNDRVTQLLSLTKGHKVDVGLMTVPGTDMNMAIVTACNKIVRDIGMRNNLTVFDLDSEVWSTMGYEYGKQGYLFRDSVTPVYKFSAPAVDVMLGRQFSPFYYYQNYKAPTGLKSLSGYENMSIRLVRAHNAVTGASDALTGSGEIFYSNFVDGVRVKYHIGDLQKVFGGKIAREAQEGGSGTAEHTHEKTLELKHKNDAFFSSEEYEGYVKRSVMGMGLSVHQVLLLPEHVIEAIPLAGIDAGVFPLTNSVDRNVGFTSKNLLDETVLDMYVSFAASNTVKRIAYEEVFGMNGIQLSDVIRGIDKAWLGGLLLDTSGINVFQDETLIRMWNQRSVYVIKHGMKYGFRNSAVFFNMGYDFDNVRIIEAKDAQYFNMIPNGGTLG